MIPNANKLMTFLSSKDFTFFIPPYQRNYEWDTEHCEVFLNDVINIAEMVDNGEQAEHFFGTITYFQNPTPFGVPDQVVLIDGQQRMTTTMLLLVALRDVIEDDATERFITNRYLKNEDAVGDSEYKIKLKQVETDWKAYYSLIMKMELTDRDRNSAVYRNYQY